jgi:MFS transporter, DHA3 family, tetracycline resistance protein
MAIVAEADRPGVLLRVRRISRPLATRDFRLVWTGQTVSALGGPFQMVALTWLVLNLTGSALALSSTLLAAALPASALLLVGGVISDRYDPRTVMIWSDAGRAIITGLIAVLALTGALPLALLDLLLLVSGLAGGLFAPAAQSIVPRLVTKEQLAAANALSQAPPQLALLVAAPVGGVLVALVGPVPALVANAISFAVAALASLAIAPLGPVAPAGLRDSLRQSARTGWAYVRGQGGLRAIILLDALLSFAAIGPLLVGLPLLAHERPQIGAGGFGLMLAGFGAGSIAGMLLAGGHGLQRRRGVAFCLLQFAQAPLVVGLAFGSLPVAIALLVTMGTLNGIATVLYLALVQARVAPEMLGRVMSFVALGAFGLAPLSQLAAGLVAAAAGPATLFTAAGLLMGAAALGGLLSPALRGLV